MEQGSRVGKFDLRKKSGRTPILIVPTFPESHSKPLPHTPIRYPAPRFLWFFSTSLCPPLLPGYTGSYDLGNDTWIPYVNPCVINIIYNTMTIFNICGVYKAMCRTEGGGGVIASGRSRMDAIAAALIKKEAVEVARERKQLTLIHVDCMCNQ